MTIYRAFGDSNTLGSGATGWPALLAAKYGISITNFAHSGDMVNDQIPKIYGVNPVAGDVSFLAIGTNDQRQYAKNNIAAGRGYYRDGYASAMAWLALASKQLGSQAQLFGSSWSSAGLYGGVGARASAIGSSATFHASGSVLFLSAMRADTGGQNGTYTIAIDGGTPQSFDSNAPGITSVNNGPFSEGLHIFQVSDGDHTLVFTQTGQTYVYPQWAAGNRQAAKPTVLVGNITNLSNATGIGYAEWGGSDANVALLNGDTADNVALLSGVAGLDVRLVDLNAAVGPGDLSPADGLHWLASGQAKVMAAFEAKAPTFYAPVQTYLGSDGIFYIGDGAARRALSVA